MYSITKEFSFEASHQLHDMPPGHQCARLHGHSYRVIVELRAEELDLIGFVVDYGELKALKDYIDERFDHRHLNDILIGQNPTAEVLAEHFFWFCRKLWFQTYEVRVSETAKTWAAFRKDEA